METNEDKMDIATAIPKEHPAYLELASMKNRDEFLSKLLEDVYKAYPSFERYTSMPEEERRKTYFCMAPSMQSKRKELRDGLAHMMADKTMYRKLVLEAAYMSLWRRYKKEYPGNGKDAYLLAQYFVSHYAGVKEKGLPPGEVTSKYAKCSFDDAFEDCVRKCPPDGRNNWEDYEDWEDYAKSMSEAEKLYIELCEDWAVINGNEIDTEQTSPEYAACCILEFMDFFLEYNIQQGHNIHTAFMEEMKIKGYGCFPQPAETAQCLDETDEEKS